MHTRTNKQQTEILSSSPRKTLLVDGYNVIRSSGLYDEHIERDFVDDLFNAAREALINDVAVFAQRRYEATVVFDGAGNPHSTGERTDVAGISVVFSATNTSADALIEELAHQAVATGHHVLVITSDAATQWTVLGKRVTRMSAVSFADEIRMINAAALDIVEEVAKKNTLAERLDEDTRAQLARWARGK